MEERLPSGAGHGTEGMIEAPATGPTQARATDAAGARSCANAEGPAVPAVGDDSSSRGWPYNEGVGVAANPGGVAAGVGGGMGIETGVPAAQRNTGRGREGSTTPFSGTPAACLEWARNKLRLAKMAAPLGEDITAMEATLASKGLMVKVDNLYSRSDPSKRSAKSRKDAMKQVISQNESIWMMAPSTGGATSEGGGVPGGTEKDADVHGVETNAAGVSGGDNVEASIGPEDFGFNNASMEEVE